MIDVRTVVISYIATNLACASIMALLWIQNRKRFNGIEFWLGNYVAVFTGFVLIALRGVISDFLSIVVANALIVSGIIWLYMGLERFVGKAEAQTHNYIFLTVFTLIHAYFAFIHPNLLARNINASVALFIGAFQIAWLVFRRLDAATYSHMRNLGVIAVLFCLVSVARVITDLNFDPGEDFLKTTSDSIMILLYQILQIVIALSLFLQVNHRLVVDLERDIIERKKSQEAARASAALYRQMFADHSAVMLLIAPETGEIVEANLAAVNFYGYPALALQKMNIQQINLLTSQEILKLRQEIQIGALNYFSVPHRLASGAIREVEINSVPIKVDERVLLYSIIHDITERKQAEEALRQTQSQVIEQQRAMATFEERERMARELHDGIGQVLGYVNVQAQAVQTLLGKNQLAEAQKNLESLEQAAQDANMNLRHYILGLRDSVPQQRDFYEALQAHLDSFRQAWGIETVFSAPQAELPVLPAAVEDQLLHIAQEALVNIRKHSEARRVEVIISLRSDEMTLIVSDDGRGFDPQLASGAEQKHFGLAIMRERAAQIGGRFEIRSVVGRGTQALTHVPILSAVDNKSERNAYSLRLLLVDDQPLFLDGMLNLLKARGLTVIGTARDGLEAFAQVKALRPDVVLMDVQMPNCDGIEATRLIKAEFPETLIVLLTVSKDDENLLNAVKYGASSYLLKSLDAARLISTLDGLARGEIQIAPDLVARLLKEINRVGEVVQAADADAAIPIGLSLRQWEVLRLVARGLTYKEVGRELHVTEPAIKYHMAQILDRLQVKNREQAVAYLHQVQEERKKKRP